MKAKDLTQADVGKWVTLRAEVTRFDNSVTSFPVEIIIPNSGSLWIDRDTILEFTGPPETPIAVGDVYRFSTTTPEWTLVALVDDICLFTTEGKSHVSVALPLNKIDWTFVRKGTNP
jgi:hypothetical protein